MKKFITLIACIVIAFTIHAKRDTVSVETAFNQKKIKLEIKGKGGYQGEVIDIKVKNLSGDSIVVFVEAGRRLDNVDSTQQDILIVRDDFILLAKGQETKSELYGFCCQASNGAPTSESKFLVGSLADAKLFDIARYISANKLPQEEAQHAIWCISDGHDLASVQDDGSSRNMELRRFISKLNDVEVPWYSTYYKKQPGQVFSGIPVRVTGTADYYVRDLAQVSINIRDEKGTVVKIFPAGNSVPRGWHLFNMDWNSEGLKKGKYFLRIYENGREVRELVIDLK